MNKDNDSDMEQTARRLRAATGNECEVTINRRVTITASGQAIFDYCIYSGDILNRSKWKWECANASTLSGALDIALAQVLAQGDQRDRDLKALKDSAAKLGLQLVEATQ